MVNDFGSIVLHNFISIELTGTQKGARSSMLCSMCEFDNGVGKVFCSNCGAVIASSISLAPVNPGKVDDYLQEIDRSIESKIQAELARAEQNLNSYLPSSVKPSNESPFIAIDFPSISLPGITDAAPTTLSSDFAQSQDTLLSASVTTPALHKSTYGDGHWSSVEVRLLKPLPKWLNFARWHANQLKIDVEVQNKGVRTLVNPILQIEILPSEFGGAWERTLGDVAPADVRTFRGIDLPLRSEGLRRVTGSYEKAQIKIKLFELGTTHWVKSFEIEIRARNDWQWQSSRSMRESANNLVDFEVLSVFAMPNTQACERIVGYATQRLKTYDESLSFCGYQDAVTVPQQIQALHDTLRFDCGIEYINPPASFGDDRELRTKKTGWLEIFEETEEIVRKNQKIRCPDTVLAERRGTCLDLALLLCSLIEHVGLHPLITVIFTQSGGHAFVGCYVKESRSPPKLPGATFEANHRALLSPTVYEYRDPHGLEQLLADESIILVDSVTLTESTAAEQSQLFAKARHSGMQHVNDVINSLTEPGNMYFLTLVDVAACRKAGYQPLQYT